MKRTINIDDIFNNATHFKFLYTCDTGRYYTINPKTYETWNKILKYCMVTHVFRFEWILNLSADNLEMVARFFDVKIPDWYEVVHNGKIVKGKMHDDDKKRFLHQKINKFIFKFSDDNLKFIKIKA